jgi:hypothetical protein
MGWVGRQYLRPANQPSKDRITICKISLHIAPFQTMINLLS